MNLRRNRIGTRAKDLWNWKPLKFSQLQGPLAVQEYIQQTIRKKKLKIRRGSKKYTKNTRDAIRLREEHMDI